MTDCLLTPHPTDPALCWCPVCNRTLPIRLLHAHRNCLVPPEPRPESERTILLCVCHGGCVNYGDRRPGYEMASVCQLDAPQSDKEPCRKKAMCSAYLRRVQFRGNECGPWQEWLALHPVKSDTMKPDKEDPDHGMVGPELPAR